jgi:hypothetical protein
MAAARFSAGALVCGLQTVSEVNGNKFCLEPGARATPPRLAALGAQGNAFAHQSRHGNALLLQSVLRQQMP